MTIGKYLTLGEASKETGVQKSTLSKALKSGKLSYVEKTSAGYKIEPSELFRIYPRKPRRTVSDTVVSERLDTPEINPDEVADWKWMHPEDIKTDICKNPDEYTAWFKIIFDRFYDHLMKNIPAQ